MRHVMIGVLALSLTFANAQDLEIIKYHQLASEMTGSNQLTVINFWATWCGPCIKELPHFEEANKMDNVRVMLVSLDFVEDEAKVKNFVQKRNLQSEVYLLDEKDYDDYMGKVDESWSGAIPATLIVDQRGRKYFYEQAFNRQELLSKINKFVN